jgi:hypothetical protein
MVLLGAMMTSVGRAVLDTGSILSAIFTSLLVSFVFSDMTVVAATDAAVDAATD